MIVQFNSSLLSLFGISRVAGTHGDVQAATFAPTTSISSSAIIRQPSSTAEVAVEAEESAADRHWKDYEAFHSGSLDGSVSTVGDLARRMYGERYVREIESTGALFEGNFINAATDAETGTLAAADGKFPDRQNAMINAFHYARETARSATYLAALKTSDFKYPGSVTTESNVALAGAEKDVANATSVLLTQFSFSASVLRTNDDGTTSFAGLEVSHRRFGKLLSIDDKGAVTLYDADGTAYAMEAYDAARPEGVIPELANLIAGRSWQFSIRV